jgi:hypothetical protein
LATKAAVDQHYTKDSQDMKDFKSQMSAALITQSVGAKFALKGNVKDLCWIFFHSSFCFIKPFTPFFYILLYWR